jgi:hypothetical protein
MTTWHDITDQLTPAQVDLLEWLQEDPLGGLIGRPEEHLLIARGWAKYNLEQSFHADVPAPAHAVEVGPWLMSKSGERSRSFRSVTGIDGLDVAVETSGSQYTDGRIEGHVSLTGDLTDLDPAGAREVAAALRAAADVVEER